MALDIETIPEVVKVNGSKEFNVTEGKKICVMVDGVEDTDLSYTVPSGKTLNVMINISGAIE